jgi:hypothetical protein
MQSSANKAKIEKYHYRFESLPGYEAEMKVKIKGLVVSTSESS